MRRQGSGTKATGRRPPAGLHGMMAVRAGARHATLAQRWLYLSLAAQETARANGFDEDQVRLLPALSARAQSIGSVGKHRYIRPDSAAC